MSVVTGPVSGSDVDVRGVLAGQHWLFIEPSVSGHHRTYLEKIVQGCVSRGIQATIATSTDEAAWSFCRSLRLGPHGQRVPVTAIELPPHCSEFGSPWADVKRELAYRTFFRAAYERANARRCVDKVFVPYLDYCLNAMAVAGSPFGPTPFEGICMRPTFHFRRMGVDSPRRKLDFAKGMLFERFLSCPTLQRALTIDETLYGYCRQSASPFGMKVTYFPDPAELVGSHSKSSARESMGIPPEARVVLLFGALDMRKGVKSLLEWIQTSGDPDIFLLAVGQETPEVARLLTGDYARSLAARGSILRINRYVSDEEEQMAFAAADVAWLKYEGFYQMSGVMTKAAKAGLELQLPDYGLLGWYKRVLETEGSLEFAEHNWANAIARLLGFEAATRVGVDPFSLSP